MQTDPNIPPTIPQIMWCGATTGVLLSVIVTPIEGVKGRYYCNLFLIVFHSYICILFFIRLQVQYKLAAGEKPQFAGPIDCVKKLFKARGIRGLYVGWFATMLHRGSNWSYFGGYEFFRRKFTGSDKSSINIFLFALLFIVLLFYLTFFHSSFNSFGKYCSRSRCWNLFLA